jgi:hypothetical protein
MQDVTKPVHLKVRLGTSGGTVMNHRYSRNICVAQDGYIYFIFNIVADVAHYIHL